ncbi:MAG: PEP-CTERM sorting domain-containing protein [Planctomycetota bacterium]
MRLQSALTAIAVLFAALVGPSPVDADVTIDISMTADGSGRFYDYFSNSYAEVGLSPNGMYEIGTGAGPLGSNVVTFNGGDWTNVGQITVAGTVNGTGVEVKTINNAVFDFDQYIEGGLLSPIGTGYSTTMSNVIGTITYEDGAITSIDMTSDIAFAFAGAPTNEYDGGQFNIVGGDFNLDLDDSELIAGAFNIRQEWNFTGTVNNVIPEPGSALLLCGVAVGFAARRRR